MQNEAWWSMSDADKAKLIRANGEVVIQDTDPAATNRDPAFACFSNPTNRTAYFSVRWDGGGISNFVLRGGESHRLYIGPRCDASWCWDWQPINSGCPNQQRVRCGC